MWGFLKNILDSLKLKYQYYMMLRNKKSLKNANLSSEISLIDFKRSIMAVSTNHTQILSSNDL